MRTKTRRFTTRKVRRWGSGFTVKGGSHELAGFPQSVRAVSRFLVLLGFVMKAFLLFLFGLVSLMLGTAYAEVPAAVTTALTDAKADGVEVAGLVLVVIIAIAAFKYVRKAL